MAMMKTDLIRSYHDNLDYLRSLFICCYHDNHDNQRSPLFCKLPPIKNYQWIFSSIKMRMSKSWPGAV